MINMADIFNNMGVRVRLPTQEDFLKVRETLTRIGNVVGDDVLEQTCFILHKRGEYALMHYLEMRAMDGEPAVWSNEDLSHRNTVAKLLDRWGLVKIIHPLAAENPPPMPGQVTVIPFRDKGKWDLVPLYEIGRVITENGYQRVSAPTVADSLGWLR